LIKQQTAKINFFAFFNNQGTDAVAHRIADDRTGYGSVRLPKTSQWFAFSSLNAARFDCLLRNGMNYLPFT
jgi:hypothetical protein